MRNLLIIALTLTIGCSEPSGNREGTETDQKEKQEEFDFNENRANQLLSINASQNGVPYPETFILMQNRKGIRIEYCVDRSALQLWISPQAGKSLDYRYQNWSNRDDHTNVFQRILIPGLNLLDFEKCDYGAFHSVLHFKNQKMHIFNVYDQPVIALWFEKGNPVDFKAKGGDKLINNDPDKFVVNHVDRDESFEFAAVIGSGDGKFRHQRDFDEARGLYARAVLTAGQPIFIGAELSKENIAAVTGKLAKTNIDDLIADNEKGVNDAVNYGVFKLKDKPEMQKLLDINKKIALSMQAEKGFMRSTNKYIYYLLWFRDGGMNTAHIGYSGWLDPAKYQAQMSILNPNVSDERPKGIFYGQLMSGPITKWEEDGLFFVMWPAFTYWTQSGDDTFIKGRYLENMEKGMDWLERRCYDEEKGLFGRYHYCETPLYKSRGNGWDNAIGRPQDIYVTKYKDDTIVRSYDIFINILNYSCYKMFAAMTDGEKSKRYSKKADVLEKNMIKFWSDTSALPSYGDLLSISDEMIHSGPFGLDRTDYIWALSISPFYPNIPEKLYESKKALFRNLRDKPIGHFMCAYNAMLTSMDTEQFEEDSIMAALDYLVPQSMRPGKYLPMPYTIPEIIDVVDGHPFHDVRPLVYSIAPWLSAVTNLGLHRLPFGIAARATKYLENIENFQYKKALIAVEYEGKGDIKNISINGNPLHHTYQIPDNMIVKGANNILVSMADNVQHENLLTGSTVRLKSVSADDGNVRFSVEAFNHNILTFKNLNKDIVIKDHQGNEMPTTMKKHEGLSYIEFDGKGDFTVEMN